MVGDILGFFSLTVSIIALIRSTLDRESKRTADALEAINNAVERVAVALERENAEP